MHSTLKKIGLTGLMSLSMIATSAVHAQSDDQGEEQTNEEGGFVERHPLATAAALVGVAVTGVLVHQGVKGVQAGKFSGLKNRLTRTAPHAPGEVASPETLILPHQELEGATVLDKKTKARNPNFTFQFEGAALGLPELPVVFVDNSSIPYELARTAVRRKSPSGRIYAIFRDPNPKKLRFVAVKVNARLTEPQVGLKSVFRPYMNENAAAVLGQLRPEGVPELLAGEILIPPVTYDAPVASLEPVQTPPSGSAEPVQAVVPDAPTAE